MLKRTSVDPWKYEGIEPEPITAALHRKQYSELKEADFYNLDWRTVPTFIDPGLVILYRYLRYEPYLYEMFKLNPLLHPYHPFHPTTEQIIKITNKHFFTTRNPVVFPLATGKKSGMRVGRAERQRETRRLVEEGHFNTAYLCAGLSEADTHLSPDRLDDWSTGDFEAGSEGTLKSWRYREDRREEQPRAFITDPLEGVPNVKELWRRIREYSDKEGQVGRINFEQGQCASSLLSAGGSTCSSERSISKTKATSASSLPRPAKNKSLSH